MKRHTQVPGIRAWDADSLLELQSEPLKALDTFFAQYGQCVVQGCEITRREDGTVNISAGLVALEAADPEGTDRVMVMPFHGAEGVALPLYLTAELEILTDTYSDGQDKPTAYKYQAVAERQKPGTPCLLITAEECRRFVDAVQDPGHRFITDQERKEWNAILETATELMDGLEVSLRTAIADGDKAILNQANTYTDDTGTAIRKDMATGDEAALRSAKAYTDQQETIIRTDFANADAGVLRDAKEYANEVVAALVDGSPEALDTLKELAEALGNDPNFATTVLEKIGEKFDKAGGEITGEVTLNFGVDGGRLRIGRDQNGTYINNVNLSGSTTTQLRLWTNGRVTIWYEQQFCDIWHSGNFDPDAQKQELEDKIDNIQVGGRNLLLNSELITVLPNVGSGATLNLSVEMIKGETYTLSYSDTDIVPVDIYPRFYIWIVSDWNNIQQVGSILDKVTTFKWNLPTGKYVLSVYNHVYEIGGTIHNLKLEKGNRATDWTPAPEEKADSDHTHAPATISAAGMMSAEDKAKLDGIVEDDNLNFRKRDVIDSSEADKMNKLAPGIYPVTNGDNRDLLICFSTPTEAANKTYVYELKFRVPYSSIGLQYRRESDYGLFSDWITLYDSTNYKQIPTATEAVPGLMSAADKAKLNKLSTGNGQIVCMGEVSTAGGISWQTGPTVCRMGTATSTTRSIVHSLGTNQYTVLLQAKVSGSLINPSVCLVNNNTNDFSVRLMENGTVHLNVGFIFTIFKA